MHSGDNLHAKRKALGYLLLQLCPVMQPQHVKSQCLRRFLVLVTGTLVYGKGDKMEAKREGLLEAGEERLFAPVATADPAQAQPSAVPGAHRRSSGGTAPIAMRATPGSLKARSAHPLHAHWPCGLHMLCVFAECLQAHVICLALCEWGNVRKHQRQQCVHCHMCHVHSVRTCVELRLHPCLHAEEAMPMWLT